MKNEPLAASEHYKLFAFFLLLIPSVCLLIGIIPVLSLIFGHILMKRNRTFSSIESSVKAINIYYKIVIYASLPITIIYLFMAFHDGEGASTFTAIIALLLVFIITISAHIFIIKHLYLSPLHNHREWVIDNGIFSNKPKTIPQANPEVGIDILQSEKLKQYSVADELVKWAKLKEDGIVSEAEFNRARSKLLNRS